MVKEVRLSKGELQSRFGKGIVAWAERTPTESTVYLPFRASTGTRLHELYHVTESPHKSGRHPTTGGSKYSLAEALQEELDAEIFASEKKGRDYLSFDSILAVAERMLDLGGRPAYVMGSITRGLGRSGYGPLDKEGRRALWNYLRESYEGRRS